MEIANIVLRLMGASQIVLFVCMLVMSSNPARVKMIGMLLMVGILCYVITPLFINYIDGYSGIASTSVMWFMASTVPAFLLLFVWVLFEEHQPFPAWLMCLFFIMVSLAFLVCLSYWGVLDWHFLKLPTHLFKAVLVFVSLSLVWHGREADLVEQRLKYRTLFIMSLASITLVVLLIELFTGFVVPAALELLGIAMITVLAFIFNAYFFRHNPLLEVVAPISVPTHDTEDEVIKELLVRMQSERLYADHDLRVASLASIMRIPEYQLRKRINQQLGYRNFNQFVNRYRIEEAGVRLLDNTKIPVLSIALEVGFRSISSFNTAFHTHFGVSPTQYRIESLVTSDVS